MYEICMARSIDRSDLRGNSTPVAPATGTPAPLIPS